MSDFDTMPSAVSNVRAGEDWLQDQAAVDWQAEGLPALADWDPALLAVARVVAFSSTPMALMMGPRGIMLANEAADRLFTGRSGSINGCSVLDVLPDSASFYATVLEKTLSGTALSFPQQPIRLEPAARRAHWFNLDFTPVCNAQGAIIGVLGVASEVTPLMHRLRDLSESEQRQRLALEGSGMVGIWTLDLATGISTADANVARMYGLPVQACREGVEDERFLTAIHPDDHSRVKRTLAQAISTATPYRCRYRLAGQNDPARWVIASATPALDEEGRLNRLLGIVVDVTDQMETASALAESRFQFQTLTEALPQIVWSSDAEGRHDYFSARWSEFTGIALADINEHTWEELVHPAHLEVVTAVWQNALRTGTPYDLDYPFRHRSGEYRWLRVMALPIRDNEGRITRWFGTSTDVHDAYRLAEEREGMARKLERIATEDQLTGALTRRAFLERATRDLDLKDLQLLENPGLLMLDIDHFKSINDGYGHPVGDKVLATTAGRIAAAIRQQDFFGRLGGEEFAVFLPQCSQDQAVGIAESIRNAVNDRPVLLDDGRQIDVTLSIGATCAPVGSAALDVLLSTADKALYDAKSAGRNRTRFAAA